MRLRALALVAVVASCAAGCGRDDITVRQESREEPNDYRRTDLRAAAAKLAEAPTSPQAYGAFAARVRELQPEFDVSVTTIAERNLVFGALPVLEAVHSKPLAEQMELLATTVWPVALGVSPEAKESPRAYLDRVCGGKLALDCKRVVPEYREVMIAAMVWSRLKDRARESLRSCNVCQGEPGYQKAIAIYEKRDKEIGALAGKAKDHSRPSAWPVAGPGSRPVTAVPVFTLRSSGEVELDGKSAEGGWDAILTRARTDAAVIAVELGPKGHVRTLRALLRAARKAKYRQVALRARLADYPYPLREYRIATNRRRGTRVMVRDVDTIQVLVQALDVISRKSGKEPVLAI